MITPVLLCGGSGTRLWPLSRKSYPKQFTALVGAESLFQASVRRLRGDEFSKPLVITGSDFRFIVTEQLAEAGETGGTVLIEPEARNTAPAVLAAALHLAATDPEAVMLVAPSDHVIPDSAAFRDVARQGAEIASAGKLLTFGISPDRPETGYGYLELSGPPNGTPVPLTRFVEKPDLATAETMVSSGSYLWNAGIFMFTAGAIIEAFRRYAPDFLPPVSAAVKGMQQDLNFFRLDAEPWASVADLSIDYAVMEKADNLMVIPFTKAWSDLGGWDAVRRESAPDGSGNVLGGEATAIDCESSLLRSESQDIEVVGIGLKNTLVVATSDAVLVADASRAQEVKSAVNALKAKGAKQATEFPRDHRPWGWFETLALDNRFQVKRIVVKPGAALSLQSHVHRSEHWIVVSGTAKVTVDDEVKLLTENQSVYIPLGAVHRMENPGKVPMTLIEVQTGTYLGEDDITRYEDVYSRGQGAKG